MYYVWISSDDWFKRVVVSTWAEAMALKQEEEAHENNCIVTSGELREPIFPELHKLNTASLYYFYGYINEEDAEDSRESQEKYGERYPEMDFSYTGTYFIVPKEYWDENGFLDDQTRGDELDGFLPDGFNETMESTFEYEGSLEDGIRKLKEAGFVFNEEIARIC